MSELQAAEALQRPLSKDFLLAEGVGSIFAGTDTTSTMLYLTFRELCLHGEMYERLHQELKLAMPVLSVQPRLIDLEALPYLSACVKVRRNHDIQSFVQTLLIALPWTGRIEVRVPCPVTVTACLPGRGLGIRRQLPAWGYDCVFESAPDVFQRRSVSQPWCISAGPVDLR